MTQKLTQSLTFKQQQNLVMTPQMQQAVKLLQMTNLELQDYLDEEMVQNPLLENRLLLHCPRRWRAGCDGLY